MLCVLYYALFCVLTIHNIIPQRFKHIGKLFVRLLQSKLLNARKKLNPIPCGILIRLLQIVKTMITKDQIETS